MITAPTVCVVLPLRCSIPDGRAKRPDNFTVVSSLYGLFLTRLPSFLRGPTSTTSKLRLKRWYFVTASTSNAGRSTAIEAPAPSYDVAMKLIRWVKGFILVEGVGVFGHSWWRRTSNSLDRLDKFQSECGRMGRHDGESTSNWSYESSMPLKVFPVPRVLERVRKHCNAIDWNPLVLLVGVRYHCVVCSRYHTLVSAHD